MATGENNITISNQIKGVNSQRSILISLFRLWVPSFTQQPSKPTIPTTCWQPPRSNLAAQVTPSSVFSHKFSIFQVQDSKLFSIPNSTIKYCMILISATHSPSRKQKCCKDLRWRGGEVQYDDGVVDETEDDADTGNGGHGWWNLVYIRQDEKTSFKMIWWDIDMEICINILILNQLDVLELLHLGQVEYCYE